MDYGATGAVIGHEISHSFDDQGAQFDATGKLANWWTPEDFAHFKASAAAARDAVRRATSRSRISRSTAQQTLSENIADVAGLAVAYDAYRLSLRRQGGAGRRRASPATSSSSSASRRAGATQAPRARAAPAASSPTATRPAEYRARHRAQPRRLVPRVRRQAGEALYLAPAERVRDLVGRAARDPHDPRLSRGRPQVRRSRARCTGRTARSRSGAR